MVAVGAAVLLVSARYVWRASAVVRAADADSLAGVESGALVRVTGTVADDGGDRLTAPFGGVDCVALRYAVEERRLSPVLLPWFVTLAERAGAVPFRVRTGTDEVAVGAATRSVVLDRRVVATVGPGETPPDRVARFERRTGPGATRWRDPPALLRRPLAALSLGARRYSEQRATPGDRVTVAGRVADGGLDPVVVADGSPAATLRRMARTSLAGLAVGAFGALLGVALVAV
jgi:hypothetical protein